MSIKKTIILIVLFLVLIFCGFAGLGSLVKGYFGGRNEAGRLVTQALTCVVALGGYYYLRKYFFIRRTSVRAVSGWPLAGWAVLGLVFAAIPYIAFQKPMLLRLDNLTVPLIISAAVFAASAAIIEEILFRDILLQGMLQHWRVGSCLLVQIVLFSAMHFFSVPVDWFAIIEFAVAAMLFSFLWLLTGNVVAPMIAHFALNFTKLIFTGVAIPLVYHSGLLPGPSTPGVALLRLTFEMMALGGVWWAWCRAGRPNRLG